MKNTIYKNHFIYLFILFTTYCFSQSNLQFNNVISAYGFENPSPVYTVPNGKIWKIERYTRDRIVVNGIGLQDTFFTIYTEYALTIDTSPIWLKSGDTFYINSGDYFFNGIEYNNTSENFQNKLEFNTVISDYGIGSISPIYTVPAGKIWKMERHTRNKLVINGIAIQDVFQPSFPYGITINTNPIWLKEGDTFYINAANYSFSALEFNKLN